MSFSCFQSSNQQPPKYWLPFGAKGCQGTPSSYVHLASEDLFELSVCLCVCLCVCFEHTLTRTAFPYSLTCVSLHRTWGGYRPYQRFMSWPSVQHVNHVFLLGLLADCFLYVGNRSPVPVICLQLGDSLSIHPPGCLARFPEAPPLHPSQTYPYLAEPLPCQRSKAPGIPITRRGKRLSTDVKLFVLGPKSTFMGTEIHSQASLWCLMAFGGTCHGIDIQLLESITVVLLISFRKCIVGHALANGLCLWFLLWH